MTAFCATRSAEPRRRLRRSGRPAEGHGGARGARWRISRPKQRAKASSGSTSARPQPRDLSVEALLGSSHRKASLCLLKRSRQSTNQRSAPRRTFIQSGHWSKHWGSNIRPGILAGLHHALNGTGSSRQAWRQSIPSKKSNLSKVLRAVAFWMPPEMLGSNCKTTRCGDHITRMQRLQVCLNHSRV